MWKFAESTSDRLNSIVDFTNIIETSSTNNKGSVRFIKYDIQGVFLKCAEILSTRLFDNVEDVEKNCSSKNKFLTELFRYFFRVLHEASSSWLKYLYNFQ
jgi:hypothetical protein